MRVVIRSKKNVIIWFKPQQIKKSIPQENLSSSIPVKPLNPSPTSQKYLITSLITSGLLAVSETLPFLPNDTNGIVDSLIHLFCKTVVENVNSDK